jgi:hypothetical protein
MIDRVVELKTFINKSLEICQKNLQLNTSQWKQAQELRDMLRKCFEVTKKLQLNDLTPGYFYRKWSGLQLLVEAHSSTIATSKIDHRNKDFHSEYSVLHSDSFEIFFGTDPDPYACYGSRSLRLLWIRCIQIQVDRNKYPVRYSTVQFVLLHLLKLCQKELFSTGIHSSVTEEAGDGTAQPSLVPGFHILGCLQYGPPVCPADKYLQGGCGGFSPEVQGPEH